AFTEAAREILYRMQPVKKVTSLATAENILPKNDQLDIRDTYEKAPQTPAAMDQLRREIQGNDLFENRLISKDEKSTMMVVETYIPIEKSEMTYDLYTAMNRVISGIPGEEEVYVAGIPVGAATSIQVMKKDNEVFFPVVFLMVVVLLYATFRTFKGVVLPLLVVITSIIWTLGVQALLGIPLNNITTAMPVFLITIGVADGIHILSEFKDNQARLVSRVESARLTMRHLALPVVMTSLTTAAGFLSLAYTDIHNIKIFGLVVAFGVMAALIFSLTFIPAILALGAKKDGAAPAKKPPPPPLGRISLGLERLALFSLRRHRLVLGASLLFLGVALVGMSRVKVENDFTHYFPDDLPFVTSTQALDKYLAGSNSISVLVASRDGSQDTFKEPEALAALDGLQKHMMTVPHVRHTDSLADLVRRMNYVMHNENKAYDRLPGRTEWSGQGSRRRQVSGRDLTSQYILLYENSGGDALSDYVDTYYTHARVNIMMSTNNSTEIQAIMREALNYAARNFPANLEVRLAGGAEMTVATNEEVVWGQTASFSLSMVMIFVLLLLQFRSMAKGLLGMIPLVFTVVFNFGVMGFLGIPLNVGTAIISSIVIGIGVDFAIHYLSRLQMEREKSADFETAFVKTMASSGKAIFSNAATVSLGFLALIFSIFVPMQQIGWLICQTMMISSLATLLLIPAAAAFFKPAFLKDDPGK
ncbi:MAG: MMPL family transporter, partial [Deltaproteobacteria bacterium]|nr:MMPL family transporter [Deltaproteobacteria bacterium]